MNSFTITCKKHTQDRLLNSGSTAPYYKSFCCCIVSASYTKILQKRVSVEKREREQKLHMYLTFYASVWFYGVSEDTGIEPWTFATLALAVRSCNHSAKSYHSARSHPLSARSHPLIGQAQISFTLTQISSTTRIDLIHTRLDLIHCSARSHPQASGSHPLISQAQISFTLTQISFTLTQISSTTRIDRIHTRLDLFHCSTRSHPHPQTKAFNGFSAATVRSDSESLSVDRKKIILKKSDLFTKDFVYC